MDELLPRLLSFPPHPPPLKALPDEKYDEGIKAQIALMQQKNTSKHLLDQTSGGESILNIINPRLNTVPYLFALNAQLAEVQTPNSSTDQEWIWSKVCNFMASFDPQQMRYLGTQVEKLISDMRTFARRVGQPGIAIEPLRNYILRLDPSGTLLTTNHIVLVKLALETQQFEDGFPVFEKPILYFPGTKDQPKPAYWCDLSLPASAFITVQNNLTTKLKHVDVLEYFLYSGMAFIGLRNWERALDCLESAVTYPAKDGACSKIMVTAYKKWILVSLLLEGKPISLPRVTSSNASKLYHVLAKPYETVATLFETASASRLKAEIDIGQKIWEDDTNLGLILNVLATYQKFQIRRLADVYSKISIPEIVNQTMSAETGNRVSADAIETLIGEMISEGTLHASISQRSNKPSILTFRHGTHALSEAEMKQDLATTAQRIKNLTQDIKTTDRLLTHDKDYIKYAVKQNAKAKNPKGGDGDGNMDWANMEDEDLMTGGF